MVFWCLHCSLCKYYEITQCLKYLSFRKDNNTYLCWENCKVMITLIMFLYIIYYRLTLSSCVRHLTLCLKPTHGHLHRTSITHWISVRQYRLLVSKATIKFQFLNIKYWRLSSKEGIIILFDLLWYLAM